MGSDLNGSLVIEGGFQESTRLSTIPGFCCDTVADCITTVTGGAEARPPRRALIARIRSDVDMYCVAAVSCVATT